jgi:hypothetical protein
MKPKKPKLLSNIGPVSCLAEIAQSIERIFYEQDHFVTRFGSTLKFFCIPPSKSAIRPSVHTVSPVGNGAAGQGNVNSFQASTNLRMNLSFFESKGCRILLNICNYLPDHSVSQPIRTILTIHCRECIMS